MELTGKESVSLYTEKDGERNFTICALNLDQLLNIFILDRICLHLIKNKTEKLVTGYLTINDMKITKGTKVSVKFKVSLKENIQGLEKKEYTVFHKDLDIADFYNYIIELFNSYACKLDTVIDNIKLELIELEIKNNEALKGE